MIWILKMGACSLRLLRERKSMLFILIVAALAGLLLFEYTGQNQQHTGPNQQHTDQNQQRLSVSQQISTEQWVIGALKATLEVTGRNRTNRNASSVYSSELTQRPPLGSGQTYVTYDNTTVIQCPRDSPYVLCDGKRKPRAAPPERAAPAPRRPFKIAEVRGASWGKRMSFSQCRYSNCVSVGNKLGPDVDLVHIFGVGLNAKFTRPPRYGNQSWIFSSAESPPQTRADFLYNEKSPWNSAFNLTMSYRTDSDVFVPYGYLAFEPTPLDKRPNYFEIVKTKNRSVVWIVSNCRAHSKRQDYVKELKKYIDVDIFGRCGNRCGDCMKELPRKYKFFLSFENSLCSDYITEKFFKMYETGMHVIPVARGGVDYGRYFPKNTFIDAANFGSPRLLAEHLKSLGSDLHSYARMLEHKDQYRHVSGHSLKWCKLCEVLNTKGLKRKTYDMKRWWGDGHCWPPTDIK